VPSPLMKLVVLCTLIAPASAFVARSATPIECELYLSLDCYIRQCHCSQHIFPFLTSIYLFVPSTYFWCILASFCVIFTVEQYIYSSSSSSFI